MAKFTFLLTLVFLSVQAVAVDFRNLTQKQIQALYDDIDKRMPTLRPGLSDRQRKDLLKEVVQNKVAALGALGKYDPPPGEIGFCFGRAMAVHLVARQMGLARHGIKKLFIAGWMTPPGGGTWRFHVATLVRGDDNKWYAIDPVMEDLGHKDPMLPKEWMKEAQKLDPTKIKTKFYLADPDAIMPDVRVVPATPADERNERLIEVGFNPERQGLTLENRMPDLGAYKVYRFDAPAQEQYFINRSESKPQEEFNFFSLDLVIVDRGKKIARGYKYGGYFPDLFETLFR